MKRNVPAVLLLAPFLSAPAAALDGQPPDRRDAPAETRPSRPAARTPAASDSGEANVLLTAKTGKEQSRTADAPQRAHDASPRLRRDWYLAPPFERKRRESLSDVIAFIEDPFRLRDRALHRYVEPFRQLSRSGPWHCPSDAAEAGSSGGSPRAEAGGYGPGVPLPASAGRQGADTSSTQEQTSAPARTLSLPAPLTGGGEVRFPEARPAEFMERVRSGARGGEPWVWVTVSKADWWKHMNILASHLANEARNTGRDPATALGAAIADMQAGVDFHLGAHLQAEWNRAARPTVLSWIDEFVAASNTARPEGYAPPVYDPENALASVRAIDVDIDPGFILATEAHALGFVRSEVAQLSGSGTPSTQATAP